MVEKYETKFHCGEDLVTVAVCSDGTLELEGYDEEYDEAVQEFGYQRSVCGDLVILWQDEDVALNKVYAIFTVLISDIDRAVQLTAEIVDYATRMLPNYVGMDVLSPALHAIKLDATEAIQEIMNALELNHHQKPVIVPAITSTMHSNYFYKMEAHADKFLNWANRNRRVIDELRSDERDSSRPATTSFLEAVGYLCRGAMFVDDQSSGGPELKHVILNNMFQATNQALWSITFSQNKRRGSDYKNTVDWFIGRFVSFMNKQENP